MKTIMKKTTILTLALVISFLGCQQKDLFEIPSELGNEENVQLNQLLSDIENGNKSLISIKQAKDYFVSGSVNIFSSDLVIKGYVVSSDASGNFYKELFLQDSSTNPTSSIHLMIDQVDSYNMFNFGREVYIDLKGLFIGESRSGNGVISVGGQIAEDGDEVDAIRELDVQEHFFRSPNTEEIIPLPVNFSAINSSHIGIYVSVNDVSIIDSEKGKPFVDPYDLYDTQRTMEACEGFGKVSFILETSSFASYSDSPLPSGTGTVAGIVNKTYNGSNLVLSLNSASDAELNGDDCDLLNIDDFEVVLSEGFDNSQDNTNLDYSGWVNFAEQGTELWTEQVFRGNGYTEFSAYRTFEDVNIGWLVTPGFDLTGSTNSFINFKLAQHHLDDDQNNTLEVFISNDFDGSNVLSATWNKLSVQIPNMSNSWYAFQDSGLIDVSSYEGTIHIGFKYVGSGTNTSLDGGYFVDDILFLKK